MDKPHRILFIVLGLFIIGLLLGWQCWPGVKPTLIADADVNGNPDALVIGDSSAPATDNVSGPVYLSANVPLYFPPPLTALNPVTSDTVSGC